MPFLPGDWTSMRDAFRSWVQDELVPAGIPLTILAEQDAPAPTDPYASVNVIAGPVPEDRVEVRTLETGPTTASEQLSHDAQVTFSVQIFARTDIASMAAARLVSMLSASSTIERLGGAGWAVAGHDGPRIVDVPMNRKWEKRAVLDVFLRARQRVTRTNVGWIDLSGTPPVSGTLTS